MDAAEPPDTGPAAGRVRGEPAGGTDGGMDGNPAPDLGVLFVHGIGHQRVGQTLVEFGDPLITWIDEWFARAPAEKRASSDASAATDSSAGTSARSAAPEAGRIDVVRSRVVADGGTPAHARVEIRVHRGGDDRTQRWLMAESCWAKAFLPPTFADLAYWGFAVYPWTSGAHYGAQLRRLLERAGKSRKLWLIAAALVLTPVYLVGGVLASILVIATLLLLQVLAIPPIPTVRAALLRAQQALAETVGDSFILVASPIQRAAILSHVSRDIEWLVARGCRRIAVVAHSQGAAVVFEAMATGVVSGRRRGDTLLVTFGSGLGKLHEMTAGRRTDKAKRGWMAIGGMALVALALQLAGIINPVPWIGTLDGAWDGGVLWIGFAGFTLWGMGTFFEDKLDHRRFDPATRFGASVRWRDFYASEDPVSNGALFDRDPTFLRSREVHNMAAPWSDHTTYWRNRDEFVPCVVRELSRFSGLDVLHVRPGDAERLANAARHRKWRVRWLASTRIVAAALAVLVVWMRWERLPAWGATALERLPAVNKVLSWIGGSVSGSGVAADDPVAQRVTGTAFVVVLVGAGYHLLYLAWRIWNWNDEQKLFARVAYTIEEGYWGFLVTFLVLADLGLLVAFGWLLGDRIPPGISEHMTWVAYLVAPGLFAGAAVLAGRIVRFLSFGPSGKSTFRATLAATLVVVPLTAIVLSVQIGEWWRIAAFAGTTAVAYALIVSCGDFVRPEMQGSARAPQRPRPMPAPAPADANATSSP